MIKNRVSSVWGPVLWVVKRNFTSEIMPTYKLTYFNLTARAEPIRFMLSYGGVPFVDNRVTSEQWAKIKSEMPMGQLPLLEIDGKKYNQSKAITRYLAKKFGVAGSDDEEAYEIDAAADSIDDMRNALSDYYWEKDPVAKDKMKESAFKKVDFSLEKFEEQVKKNGGHFVRGKLSWADILYAADTDYLSNSIGKDLNRNHPELKKLVGKVKTIPNIKAYVDKRPEVQV